MGYYTDFQLNTTPAIPDHEIDSFLNDLNEISGYVWADDFEIQGIKWYQWDQDMKLLSEKYPEYVFQLDGQGEESPDIWRAYFKNGKTHYAKARIVYDAFDESKLS